MSLITRNINRKGILRRFLDWSGNYQRSSRRVNLWTPWPEMREFTRREGPDWPIEKGDILLFILCVSTLPSTLALAFLLFVGRLESCEHVIVLGIEGLQLEVLRAGGGFGSIIGRNSFQRQTPQAHEFMSTVMKIYSRELA